MKSILISCGARLAPFDIAELREIMSDDELELDTLGDRKTALFLIMSDTDTRKKSWKNMPVSMDTAISNSMLMMASQVRPSTAQAFSR